MNRKIRGKTHPKNVVALAISTGDLVVVYRRKKPVAAVVPITNPALLDSIEDLLDMEAARKALKNRRTIPWEQVKASLKL